MTIVPFHEWWAMYQHVWYEQWWLFTHGGWLLGLLLTPFYVYAMYKYTFHK